MRKLNGLPGNIPESQDAYKAAKIRNDLNVSNQVNLETRPTHDLPVEATPMTYSRVAKNHLPKTGSSDNGMLTLFGLSLIAGATVGKRRRKTN